MDRLFCESNILRVLIRKKLLLIKFVVRYSNYSDGLFNYPTILFIVLVFANVDDLNNTVNV